MQTTCPKAFVSRVTFWEGVGTLVDAPSLPGLDPVLKNSFMITHPVLMTPCEIGCGSRGSER
jgi:hypothetical protein